MARYKYAGPALPPGVQANSRVDNVITTTDGAFYQRTDTLVTWTYPLAHQSERFRTINTLIRDLRLLWDTLPD